MTRESRVIDRLVTLSEKIKDRKDLDKFFDKEYRNLK